MSPPYTWCLRQPLPANYTGHMQAVNVMAPLPSLAFCLYFLRQNNGYKRQSGKNKIWCKAQILVPEVWVNWPGGLVKKKKKQPRREGEHYYWPTSAPRMCQCFNNFLQASWPLALVLLHRTKTCPPKLVSVLYCVPLFHGKSLLEWTPGLGVFSRWIPLH